jgi:predicted amidohydrolase
VEYRIALAQVETRLGDVDANLEIAADAVRRAATEGAALLLLPELALTGYLLQDLVPEVAMRADDARLLGISSGAPGMLIAVGFVEETDDHRYCNSAALVRDGVLVGLHRKVYLPTYGLFDEGRFTRAGDRVRTHDAGSPIGRIGLSVCEDFWHASLPMLQALDGASLLVNLAAGPSRAPGSDAGLVAIEGWHKMQDTYALLGTVPLAFCNRVGNEEGLTFWGGSRLLAADGSTVVQAPLWEPALVVGTLNSDDLRMTRYGLPILADERLELVRRELDRIIGERAGMDGVPDPGDGE